MTIAADKHKNDALTARVVSLGGYIDYRFDPIDLLIAIVPVASVDELTQSKEAVSLAVELVGSENVVGRACQAPRAFAQTHEHEPFAEEGVGRDLIPKDMEVPSFVERDPRFDGRGVVIAHLESFPDLLRPELSTALDATGQVVPKYIDLVSMPPTTTENPTREVTRGGLWTRALGPAFRGGDAAITVGDQALQLPRPGTYRLTELVVPAHVDWLRPYFHSLFEASGGASVCDALRVPILWSDEARTAWVSWNGGYDFRSALPVTEYAYRPQFGRLVLSMEKPDADVEFGYTIQREGKRLSVNLGFSEHATMTAGALAARAMSPDGVSGVAPGAQILAVATGRTRSSNAKALVRAFADPRVDVVMIQGSTNIHGSDSIVREGRSALAIVLERLVERYDKPTFVTTGNDPGIGMFLDTSLPRNVIGVGAHQSAASIRSYYAEEMTREHDLHIVGVEGPADDGALKPDLLAPANPITLRPVRLNSMRTSYCCPDWLPAGYMIGGGTSTATPVAAGAAALLVGAAKLEGRDHGASKIHRALRESARLLPDVPSHKQGRGLLQVEPAWEHLLQHSNGEVPRIDVVAPVRTGRSHLLHVPHRGRGLYETEKWTPGIRQSREIALTRTSGSMKPIEYRLRWALPVTAFSSPPSVNLPLGVTVSFPVSIHPDFEGVHSNVLEMIDTMSGARIAEVPVTIIAVDTQVKFPREWLVPMEMPLRQSRFLYVPDAAQELVVTKTSHENDVSMQIRSPVPSFGRRTSRNLSDGVQQVTIESPVAGVWEIVLYAGATDVVVVDRSDSQTAGIGDRARGSILIKAIVR